MIAATTPLAPHSVDDWVDAAEEALHELSGTALGYDQVAMLSRSDQPATELGGAYIQLSSEEEVVQVGLCATREGLVTLACALLGSSDPLSHADVTDAVGELVNILAGGVKARLGAGRPRLQLGLPIFIQGHLEARERQTLRVCRVRMSADLEAVVVLLHGKRAGS